MQLQKIVNQENQKCWGKPLGSEILWKGHVETIQRIQQMATQIKIKEVMQHLGEIRSDSSIYYYIKNVTSCEELSKLVCFECFE